MFYTHTDPPTYKITNNQIIFVRLNNIISQEKQSNLSVPLFLQKSLKSIDLKLRVKVSSSQLHIMLHIERKIGVYYENHFLSGTADGG